MNWYWGLGWGARGGLKHRPMRAPPSPTRASRGGSSPCESGLKVWGKVSGVMVGVGGVWRGGVVVGIGVFFHRHELPDAQQARVAPERRL